METVLWGTVVKSLRSLQTFWQIRFFSSNPADYRWTGLSAGSAFVVLRSFFCIDLFLLLLLLLFLWQHWTMSNKLDTRRRETRSKCNQATGATSFAGRDDEDAGI